MGYLIEDWDAEVSPHKVSSLMKTEPASRHITTALLPKVLQSTSYHIWIEA